MIELKNPFIRAYRVDNDDYNNYIVYIKEDAATYEAYLQNKNYGVISLMFGTPNNYLSLEDFITIVNNNIELEIKLYQDLYENEEDE